MEDQRLIRIPPFNYVHITDGNTILTRVVIGPASYVLKDHEQLKLGGKIMKMIQIPPRNYCVIRNPVILDENRKITYDDYGMVKVNYGELEVRTSETHPDPFPLYPSEEIEHEIQKIPIVQPNCALKLKAIRDFVDSSSKERHAGDEWLCYGPCTYIPNINCQIIETVRSLTIKPNSALKIRAKKETTDKYGNARKAGEEWLIREIGDYLPQVDEEVVEEIKSIVLTDKRALHLRALKSFKDIYNINRKAGEEWLVTIENSDTHIPDIYEIVVKQADAIVLTNRQYCYILDPFEGGKNKWGKRELRKGECTFFLKPFETLESGIQDIYVLADDEALLLKAKENYKDEEGEDHTAGEMWMIYGPRDYIPSVEVSVVERRKKIPLDENEGIYVRDNRTGEVKAVSGESYMLKSYESLWEMELSPEVEELIKKQAVSEALSTSRRVVSKRGGRGSSLSRTSSHSWSPVEEPPVKEYSRDKTRAVTFRVPSNTAVQVHNFRTQISRVVFGPDRVMLQPDEQFTVITLSGGIPKKEGQIKDIALMLGPSFMSDIVVVETSDHASLQMTLSYNWYFDVNKENPIECNKLFAIKDFIGDACKTIASRVRGSVSCFTFEDFHQRSADIIKAGVFGKKGDSIKKEIRFPANNCVITHVDIQSVEPTDERTQASLKKSVNQAIEITTEASKARAQHEAAKAEQISRNRLELQKVQDEIDAEQEKVKLIELKVKNVEVQMIGKATGEALAKAKSQKIENQSLLEQTELTEQAKKIENETELGLLKEQYYAEVAHQKALDELEINKAKELAAIETQKFQEIVDAIGRETIVAMAKAGPELQAKLLKGLGLKGFMLMNSKNPINLFSTASGFIQTPSNA
ncbi:unnamed protein product [Blepharisma stoltei]|uniref:Major vault protein n=1 Tax=Blepharisma stoltei TaxID=1481888 RepID=A0AAU9J8I7_9CILI|nr:unnamed protein product [Blepharisma stoltei]